MESFALSVLSLEDSYDLYLMSSRQNISENIRNKGSFYPLNEVKGVNEYIEACFPYIKEAARTEDGEIWMLPISIDIPCLLYNEELCMDKGIDLTAATEMEELVDFLRVIQEDNSLKDSHNISLYMLTENIFHQYLRSYKNFDTELFSNIASLLKNKLNYLKGEVVLGNPSSVWEMLRTGDTDNFLIDLEYYLEQQARYASTSNIRLRDLPNVTNKKTSVATCLFIAVNPYSKNLKSTLGYISSLCDYILKHDEAMLFHDRNRYPSVQAFSDLYDIYSNGEIAFTYPDELYMKDYEKYLLDEIDLDTFILEANRKLHAYMNE